MLGNRRSNDIENVIERGESDALNVLTLRFGKKALWDTGKQRKHT